MSSPDYLIGYIESALSALQKVLDASDGYDDFLGGADAEQMGIARDALRIVVADMAALRDRICAREPNKAPEKDK